MRIWARSRPASSAAWGSGDSAACRASSLRLALSLRSWDAAACKQGASLASIFRRLRVWSSRSRCAAVEGLLGEEGARWWPSGVRVVAGVLGPGPAPLASERSAAAVSLWLSRTSVLSSTPRGAAWGCSTMSCWLATMCPGTSDGVCVSSVEGSCNSHSSRWICSGGEGVVAEGEAGVQAAWSRGCPRLRGGGLHTLVPGPSPRALELAA